MGFESLHNTIRSRFNTKVATPLGVPTVYDNAPDTHPDNAQWVRLTVQEDFTSLVEFGAANTYRTTGAMVAQIFQPLEDGDQPALSLADTIVANFRAVTDSGVRFLVPTINPVGRSDSWWQVNVICPFKCDDTI